MLGHWRTDCQTPKTRGINNGVRKQRTPQCKPKTEETTIGKFSVGYLTPMEEENALLATLVDQACKPKRSKKRPLRRMRRLLPGGRRNMSRNEGRQAWEAKQPPATKAMNEAFSSGKQEVAGKSGVRSKQEAMPQASGTAVALEGRISWPQGRLAARRRGLLSVAMPRSCCGAVLGRCNLACHLCGKLGVGPDTWQMERQIPKLQVECVLPKLLDRWASSLLAKSVCSRL